MTAIVLASIAGAISILSAAIAATSQRRIAVLSADLARQQKQEDQRLSARAVLDRYRAPLLFAAWELADRIDNIRTRGLLAYRDAGSPLGVQAKLSTMFRFAQYLGWREILRAEVQLLRFEADADTRLTSDLLGDVTRVLATDSQGPDWMLWSDEQRGVGELMIDATRGDGARCIGYATFVSREGDFNKWLDPIATALELTAADSRRLMLLQWALVNVVLQLDKEGICADTGVLKRTQQEIARRSAPTGEVEDQIRRRRENLRGTD